jgi:1-acyl-sn-glycerol-3-phosphate acyltransferase
MPKGLPSPLTILRNLAFYLAFWGGSIFIVGTCVIWLALKQDRLFRVAVDSWSAWHRRCMRHLLGLHIRTEGAVPPAPVLVVFKHESFFEAIDLAQVLPNPGVFAKAELLRIPFWGWVGHGYGLIAVERDQGAKALRHMLSAAKAMTAAGRPLALFPEGTRIPHGERAEIKSGFAGLYKLLGLPVVPIAVNAGPLYHRWIKQPGTITYKIGEVIPAGLPRDEAEARVQAGINALNAV